MGYGKQYGNAKGKPSTMSKAKASKNKKKPMAKGKKHGHK